MTVAAEPVNIAAMAKRLRKTRMTIYRWQQEGCPIEEGDEAVLAWVAARREARESESDEADDLKERKLRAEGDKAFEDARWKKLKNDILEKKLVYRDEASLEVTELVNMIRTRLESAPNEIISEIPVRIRDESELERVREIALERITDKVFLILTELSQWKAESLEAGDV